MRRLQRVYDITMVLNLLPAHEMVTLHMRNYCESAVCVRVRARVSLYVSFCVKMKPPHARFLSILFRLIFTLRCRSTSNTTQGRVCTREGIAALALPFADGTIPTIGMALFDAVIVALASRFLAGHRLLIHCRAGKCRLCFDLVS